jgi:hypothetical protein
MWYTTGSHSLTPLQTSPASESESETKRTRIVAAVWAMMKAITGARPGRSLQKSHDRPCVRVTKTVERPETDTY